MATCLLQYRGSCPAAIIFQLRTSDMSWNFHAAAPSDRVEKHLSLFAYRMNSPHHRRSLNAPERHGPVRSRACSGIFRLHPVTATGLWRNSMRHESAVKTPAAERRVQPIESEYGEHLRAKTAPLATTARTNTAAVPAARGAWTTDTSERARRSAFTLKIRRQALMK